MMPSTSSPPLMLPTLDTANLPSPTELDSSCGTVSASDVVSPWTKRASKACCSCRRDKIKCDGLWPCAACVKKGIPGNKCIEGCLPCRRLRLLCSGEKPCRQCVETNQDCVDEIAALSLKAADEATSTKPVERAKLACAACRRDNKKCDDNRPCTRCTSRQEECIHVGRGPKVVKQRCLICRRDNKKCEDHRPCKYCFEADWECEDVPRRGGGQGSRVKKACINCRRNKVQCGSERPCPICLRRGLECVDRACSCADKGKGDCEICRTQTPVSKTQILEEAFEAGDYTEGQTYPPDISPRLDQLSYHNSTGIPLHPRSAHSYDQTQQHAVSQGYIQNPNRFRVIDVTMDGLDRLQNHNVNTNSGLHTHGSTKELPTQPNFVSPFQPLPDSVVPPDVGIDVGVNAYGPWAERAHRPASIPIPVSMAYPPRMQFTQLTQQPQQHSQSKASHPYPAHHQSGPDTRLPTSVMMSSNVGIGVGVAAYGSGIRAGASQLPERAQRPASMAYPSPAQSYSSQRRTRPRITHIHDASSSRSPSPAFSPQSDSLMQGVVGPGVGAYSPGTYVGSDDQLPGGVHRPTPMTMPPTPPIQHPYVQQESQSQFPYPYLTSPSHQSFQRDPSFQPIRHGDYWHGPSRDRLHPDTWDTYLQTDLDVVDGTLPTKS